MAIKVERKENFFYITDTTSGQVLAKNRAKDVYYVDDEASSRFFFFYSTPERDIRIGRKTGGFTLGELIDDGDAPFGSFALAQTYLDANTGNFSSASGGSGAINVTQQVNQFQDLVAGTTVGDLAYCETSQGTAWLPGTIGGTYYPAGFYLWNGAVWTSDRNSIAEALQGATASGGTTGQVWTKNSNTDFDSGWATPAGGGGGSEIQTYSWNVEPNWANTGQWIFPAYQAKHYDAAYATTATEATVGTSAFHTPIDVVKFNQTIKRATLWYGDNVLGSYGLNIVVKKGVWSGGSQTSLTTICSLYTGNVLREHFLLDFLSNFTDLTLTAGEVLYIAINNPTNTGRKSYDLKFVIDAE